MREIEHFVPGQERVRTIPLERYLQLLPSDVVSEYVARYTNPGDLILDPFAHTGTLPLTAVAQGRRAIASDFNPINTLIARALLTLPSPHELDTATTRLGDSLKRGVTLREHISQLYATTCQQCLLRVSADYFVWDGQDSKPVAKHYDCPHCAIGGEFPVDERDLEALDQIEKQGVHYWYLLERLAQPYEVERTLAQRLLELYTPRNLYALTDLSMKIDLLFANSPMLGALQLMLLDCLDNSSKLDVSSLPRETTRLPRPPTRFVERNVWGAFEESYRQVRQLAPVSSISVGSHLEEPYQALVINEPLRKLGTILPPSSVSLVITAPPTYYRPFWTLSYLWSGWLWGRDKAALFRPLLRRKLMGWSWYRKTLSVALSILHRTLRPRGKVVFILDTDDLNYVSNLMLAAIGAGFRLERSLYQPKVTQPPSQPMQTTQGAYRLSFARDETVDRHHLAPSVDELASALQKTALAAVEELLRERGEALHFGWLHNAICQRWAHDGLLRQTLILGRKVPAAEFLDEQMQASLEQARTAGSLETLSPSPTAEVEPSLWWLRDKGYPGRPLGDRVEKAVRTLLIEGRELPYGPLKDRIYTLFPGPFTPGPGLVEACLSSYALEDEASGRYRLPAEDSETGWQTERREALGLLVKLGSQMGYHVALATRHQHSGYEAAMEQLADQEAPWHRRLPTGLDVVWEEEGEACHLFAFRQTTVLGDILSDESHSSAHSQRYLVIVDRRVQLLRFRMETELLLRRALSAGEWRLIKLSPLRVLARKEAPDRQELEQIIGLEPLIESPEAQLPLFP